MIERMLPKYSGISDDATINFDVVIPNDDDELKEWVFGNKRNTEDFRNEQLTYDVVSTECLLSYDIDYGYGDIGYGSEIRLHISASDIEYIKKVIEDEVLKMQLALTQINPYQLHDADHEILVEGVVYHPSRWSLLVDAYNDQWVYYGRWGKRIEDLEMSKEMYKGIYLRKGYVNGIDFYHGSWVTDSDSEGIKVYIEIEGNRYRLWLPNCIR